MSLNTMTQRMVLEIPGLSSPYARTLLNEALHHIEDEQLWSFQLKESNWLTPGLLFPVSQGGVGVSTGTISVQPGSTQIIGSAQSSAAWATYNAQPNNIANLTECQIRSPYYSLYNIIAYDTTSNPPFGTLTIDRPWGEPGGTALSYMIYQAYFPVPATNPPPADPDFRRFIAAMDTTNAYPLDYWSKSRRDLAFEDPQRTIFDDPAYIVPYETDQRPNSPTLGSMLYELWPHPLSILPYTYSYICRGPSLVNPSDKVPYPFTEDMVLWQAKVEGFLWKEAQKGENIERGAGADYRFLSGAAATRYKDKLREAKDKDRDLCELYINKYRVDYAVNTMDGYANIAGGLNVGRM